ncbi:biopolymer transporter ExbD [bacterium]|nr:biopolymer transporter ExbD [bacterium]
MKIKKKERRQPAIPTASLPDVIFMLLFFFMVSAVFKEFRGVPLVLPSAKKIEKLRGKRDVGYLWIDRTDQVNIDDRYIELSDVADIMYIKRADPTSPLRVVSLKIDREVKMGRVNDVQDELKKADCLNINYATKTR